MINQIDPYLFGIAGNLLFGIKSLPQIIFGYRRKDVSGVSTAMLILDFFGNTGCAYFIYSTTGFVLWPQFVNYFFATLLLIILFIMKIVYR